jgi:hypothetical protein
VFCWKLEVPKYFYGIRRDYHGPHKNIIINNSDWVCYLDCDYVFVTVYWEWYCFWLCIELCYTEWCGHEAFLFCEINLVLITQRIAAVPYFSLELFIILSYVIKTLIAMNYENVECSAHLKHNSYGWFFFVMSLQ